jgi:DNA-binding MarR family transcriptional regulator
MVVKRKRGERSQTIINEVDYMILKIIKESKKEVAIMWLRSYLNISAISLRTHINRMIKLKFITREKVPKTNRSILNLTKDGEDILKILMRVVKK